ncbi:MAG: alpha-L-fucosidase [Bacteroidales bacterium]|nr:alpha-L-fucosidase [Bacteroidales bacterium]
MNKRFFTLLLCLLLGGAAVSAQTESYTPSESNLRAREKFASHRLGIFLHWGIYSSYAQGEWYLSNGKLDREAYYSAANGFCPARFDAAAWARAFKEAGAGYVTLTSRHHDGFSMFRTAQSPYNIVDGTPYGKDVSGMLTEAVKAEGMDMHFYYSILDWLREDYPKGRSGIAKDDSKADYNHYLEFEKAQIRELLTQYHPSALWFDGMWDHREAGFPWQMEELYRFIHDIDPACLIGNNHHIAPIPGEDFQMFERDLPGENKAGMSGQAVSTIMPLEMCQTMNGAWGYKIDDQKYKSVKELIQLLVRAAAKGSNLLINIGPQADGQLPAPALDRLKGMGGWMKVFSRTVDGTDKTAIPEQPWGVSTRNATSVFLHILEPANLPSDGKTAVLVIPFAEKITGVSEYKSGENRLWKTSKDGFLTITLPAPDPAEIDTVLEIKLK